MRMLHTVWFLGSTLVLGAAVPGAAQNAPPARRDTTDTGLVMEREVFRYPEYARRNPFAPLLSAEGGGPRYERLVLSGIILSSDPSASIAIFGEASATGAPGGAPSAASGRSYRMKIGERIGNTTVLEIHERHVVVAVDEFGQTERHTMELRRRTQGQGGPS